ncbi:MAG: putative holin [Desulfovibrio sp.]
MFHKFHSPRLLACSVAAALLVAALAVVSPVQLPVMLYKLSLVLLAGYVGYWLDRWLFPYARPDGYLAREWRAHDAAYPDDEADYAVVPGYASIFAAALLRRALIVLGVMLAVCLGL